MRVRPRPSNAVRPIPGKVAPRGKPEGEATEGTPNEIQTNGAECTSPRETPSSSETTPSSPASQYPVGTVPTSPVLSPSSATLPPSRVLTTTVPRNLQFGTFGRNKPPDRPSSKQRQQQAEVNFFFFCFFF